MDQARQQADQICYHYPCNPTDNKLIRRYTAYHLAQLNRLTYTRGIAYRCKEFTFLYLKDFEKHI